MQHSSPKPKHYALTDEIRAMYPERHNPIFQSCVDLFDLTFIDRALNPKHPLSLGQIFANKRKMLDVTLVQRFDRIVRHRTSVQIAEELNNQISMPEREAKPYILVGPTGCGKTSLLLYYFNIQHPNDF